MANILKATKQKVKKIFTWIFAYDRCYTCNGFLTKELIYDKSILCELCKSKIRRPAAVALQEFKNEKIIMFSYGLYDPPLKEILYAKYAFNPTPYYFIGREIAKIILENDLKIDYLIPIPQSFFSFCSRGFNQAEEMILGINEIIKIPMLDIIKVSMLKTKQAGLNRDARIENLFDKFYLKNKKTDLTEKTICLIDDVYTTGTTINIALRELKKCRFKRCFVFTAARCR